MASLDTKQSALFGCEAEANSVMHHLVPILLSFIHSLLSSSLSLHSSLRLHSRCMSSHVRLCFLGNLNIWRKPNPLLTVQEKT